MTDLISWFEIPTIDFERAVGFYSTVLDREIDVITPEADASNERIGIFHTDEGNAEGMIVETDTYTSASGATISYTPAADSGLVVCLTVDGDLNDALSTVESTGGEILVPKEPLPAMGVPDVTHYAVVVDTEGNRVGLMSAE